MKKIINFWNYAIDDFNERLEKNARRNERRKIATKFIKVFMYKELFQLIGIVLLGILIFAIFGTHTVTTIIFKTIISLFLIYKSAQSVSKLNSFAIYPIIMNVILILIILFN